MLSEPNAPTNPDIIVRRWTHNPRNVPTARTELRRHMTAWGIPLGVADTAALVLTELLTNAIRHAREPRGRHIETRFHRGANSVRIEVHDANPDKPERRRASAEDETGRGLNLVNNLTGGRWDAGPREGVGKMVWAECGPVSDGAEESP